MQKRLSYKEALKEYGEARLRRFENRYAEALIEVAPHEGETFVYEDKEKGIKEVRPTLEALAWEGWKANKEYYEMAMKLAAEGDYTWVPKWTPFWEITEHQEKYGTEQGIWKDSDDVPPTTEEEESKPKNNLGLAGYM